jgi:glycosyltransferase involved in cell wall biosynthesis
MGELRATAVTPVFVIVPAGVDDASRPSGGNAYDRRVCDGLAALDWVVTEVPIPGSWPCPDAAALRALSTGLADIPDDSVVLIDGLVASAAADVLEDEAGRVRPVALVHMPLVEGHPPSARRSSEGRALATARAVIATSRWSRQLLVERHRLDPGFVRVAEPGVDRAAVTKGESTGRRLICVANVLPHKGHDVLLAALSAVDNLDWECRLVGALSSDPGFAERLSTRSSEGGISDRVRFLGPLEGLALNAAYAESDVLVLASRAESYGMVVTEALARGLPCIATAVGGIPSALGRAADGGRPGLLVRPDDALALASALRCWLENDTVRRRLRRRARERRATLTGWETTVATVSQVLAQVAA